MAVVRPSMPQAPMPPVVPGFSDTNEAIGEIKDFSASGKEVIEGVQERAASAVKEGEERAANARAAGEKLMGTPVQQTTNEEVDSSDSAPKRSDKMLPDMAATDAIKSQATVKDHANSPQAAQTLSKEQQSMPKGETLVKSSLSSKDEEPAGFDMMHLAFIAFFCAGCAGVLFYLFLQRKKDASTSKMRAAREAELLKELATIRAAREKREAERSASAVSAGLLTIAGRGDDKYTPPKNARDATREDRKGAAADSGTFVPAPILEALAAFRQASRILDSTAGIQATEEAKKAERIATARKEREPKEKESSGFEVRI